MERENYRTFYLCVVNMFLGHATCYAMDRYVINYCVFETQRALTFLQ